MRIITRIVGFVAIVAATLGVALVVTLRTQFSPGLAAIRRMNKAVFNPAAMATAGKQGASASVIEHVGRSSGTPYRTPVGVIESEIGLVITLPYGETADWVKNVLSASTAVIVHEGATIAVERPEIVSLDAVESMIDAREARNARLFGIDRFMVLHETGVAAS